MRGGLRGGPTSLRRDRRGEVGRGLEGEARWDAAEKRAGW